MTTNTSNNCFEDYEALCKAFGTELVDAELALELESQNLGQNRMAKHINEDKASSGASAKLIANAVPMLSSKIKAWLDEANNSTGGGRKHTAAPLIQLGDTDSLACITIATVMRHAFATTIKGSMSFNSVALDVARAVEDEFRFKRVFDSMAKNKAKAAQAGLDKRIGVSYKKAFIKAIENREVESGKLESWEKWSNQAKLRVGGKLLELAAESTGIFELILLTNADGDHVYNISIKGELMESLEQQNNTLIELGFVNRPMVIPPKPWTGPMDGGYYIDLKSPNPFIRMNKGKLLALYSDVDMPNVYAAVNTIQATPWRINTKVLKIAESISSWQAIPECLEFPSNEPAEKPVRPLEADENPELHEQWKQAMLHYYQQDNSRKGKRLQINALLTLANQYKEFDKIYFPHNIDFRGRVYPLTLLSPQSNDFGKALIEFADGKPIDATGAKWLAFHGANCYGLDKKPMDERFAWAASNTELIQGIADDPLTNTEWMSADSPWEFLAWCFEWAEYLKTGEGFVSRIPIAFDGSCSGLQHYSAMLRDPIGGAAVNLVPSDSVQDIYRLVSDEVTKLAQHDLTNGTEDTTGQTDDGTTYTKLGTKTLAKQWLDHGINRSVTKQPVMTLAYGSKQFGFKGQILEKTIYPAIAKNPDTFPKPSQAAAYMAGLVWEGVHKVVVKAMEAMEWLQETSALLANQKGLDGNSIPTYWVTPAGFPVYQAYEKTVSKRIHLILGKGVIIKNPAQLNEEADSMEKNSTNTENGIHPRINENQPGHIDPRKQRQGIAPNFVHSMDASHLMLTVLACADKGINSFAMIHDSYGTTAADAETMFHTVREVFVSTYTEHDVLRDIYEQVRLQLSPKALKKLKQPPTQGTLDLSGVINSKYAFS